jgi:hypothetical protein
LIRDLITLIATTNVYAVIWRRLLLSGVERKQTIGTELREMLCQVPILTLVDTTDAAGALIAAVFAHLPNEDRARIEQSILAVPPNVLKDGTQAHLTRDRLLGCIPSHLISTSQADEIRKSLEATGGLPPNEPLFKIGEGGFKEFTIAEYLREQGVPVDDPVNRRLIDLVDPIKRFCTQYLNQAPPDEQIAEIHPQLSQLAEAIRTADLALTRTKRNMHSGISFRRVLELCVAMISRKTNRRLNLPGEFCLTLVRALVLRRYS